MRAPGCRRPRNNSWLRMVFFCGLAIVMSNTPAQPVSVSDDSGRSLRLEQPARRIIALSPHATELVFAAGAGDRLIGVTSYSDYPPAAKAIPRIGSNSLLDRERFLALRPDLIIGWPTGNRPMDLAWLEKRGFKLYHSRPEQLADIAQNIRDIGLLAGTTALAETAAQAFTGRLRELRTRYANRPRLRVFYQVWHKPLITVGARHFISQAMALCGAVPLFPQLTAVSPVVSREAVIAADPQAIVTALDDLESKEDPFRQWRRWTGMEAIRTDRLVKVHGDLVHRPTPRLLQGAELICAGLAGERPAP